MHPASDKPLWVPSSAQATRIDTVHMLAGVQHAHGSSRGSGAATVESSVIPPQAIATPSGRRPWLRLPPAPFEEINSPGDGRLGPTTTRVVTGRSNPSDPAGMESLMLTNQTQASGEEAQGV